MVLDHVLGVDAALALVGGLPAQSPAVGREVLVERRRAGGDEKLRNLLAVEVFAHRGLGLRAKTAEHREDLVLLDELVRQQHRLGRVVLVVEDLEDDLAAVDAAVVVDVREVGVLGVGDGSVRRCRPGLGDGVAEQDLCSCDADVGTPLGGARASARSRRHKEGRQRGQTRTHPRHGSPP